MSFRAGLFFLLVLLAFGFSAPIPSRPSSLVEHYDINDNELLIRSNDVLGGRGLDTADPSVHQRDYLVFDGRDLDEVFDDYVKRNFEDIPALDERDFDDEFEYDFAKREEEVLERRGVGAKIKHAFQSAFHKVGHFFQDTGKKIAKFGLKIAAAGASVLSKATKLLPGIGTGISTALKGVAIGANAASEKIRANLGAKLNKVSKALNYVISPIGTAGKKLGKKGKVLGALFG